MALKECTFENCSGRAKGRGLCGAHWWQWRYKGSLTPLRKPLYVCTISGCGKPHSGRGYCYTHFNNFKRRGDPLAEGIHKKHGKTGTPEFFSWSSMKSRCYTKSQDAYPYYGGKGITVCDRWLGRDGLDNFVADMGTRPSKEHSLDRIDSKGNYEPNNCRWATKTTQANNQSRNRKITWNGETHGVAEWVRKLGLKFNSKYYARLNKGWDIEKVFAD